MRDRPFQTSNTVFTAVLKELRREGLDTTAHKAAVEPEDVQKMYSSGVLCNSNPTALQRKVWFELSLHFGRRGREGFRTLRKNSFRVEKDPSGKKFVSPSYNEKEKNHSGVSNKETEKNAVMYEQPGDERCPVKSFELYISKLNPKCDSLFQRPAKCYDGKSWYDNMPLGHNKIGDMMKNISKDAHLSKTYTNHCVRATVSTALHQAGLETERIKAVTGHKSSDSLQHYIRGPSQKQKEESSSILHKYGASDSASDTCINPASPHKDVAVPHTSGMSSSMALSNTTLNVPHVGSVGSLFSGASFVHFALLM